MNLIDINFPLFYRNVDIMVFFGLTLNSVSLFGNLYWNFAAGGLIELTAYGLCHLLSTCSLGRRAPQAFFLVLAGVSVASAHFVPPGEDLFLEYHVVSIAYIPAKPIAYILAIAYIPVQVGKVMP